jgi:hypothetical protein
VGALEIGLTFGPTVSQRVPSLQYVVFQPLPSQRTPRFKVGTFEILDDPAQDILSSVGFILAVRMLLQVRGRGILHFATVCSSWVMINRSTSGRSPYCPLGDTAHQYVRDANVMVSRSMLLALFGLALGHDWALEQPSSSLMFFHPRPGHTKIAHGRSSHLHRELLMILNRGPLTAWERLLAHLYFETAQMRHAHYDEMHYAPLWERLSARLDLDSQGPTLMIETGAIRKTGTSDRLGFLFSVGSQ